MRRSLLWIIAALLIPFFGGCVQTPDDGRGRRDDASPKSVVAEAAARSVDQYRDRLALEWQKTADTAGSFNDWQPAYEDLQKRLKIAREESFRPFTDACDRETGTGETKYDPDILERVAREAAAGFRRAGNEKK